MNPAPGLKHHPQHRVEVSPALAYVLVMYQGELIADTREAVDVSGKPLGKESREALYDALLPQRSTRGPAQSAHGRRLTA